MKLTVLLGLASIASSYSIFGSLAGLGNVGDTEPSRLIKLGPEDFEIVSERTKLNYKRNNINFIDITNKISIEKAKEEGYIKTVDKSFLNSIMLLGSKQLTEVVTPKVYGYPTEIQFNDRVKGYIETISTENMYKDLSKFTSFYTRYYKSQTGVESAEWLEQQVLDLTEKTDVTIKRVNHQGWDQFSLIASIPGEVDTKVVVGAHQDSVNLLAPSLLRSPGADDDGSGTVTILEVFRILMEDYKNGGFKPHHTLEFHWYSAEEGGLLGSFDVYQKYQQANETVVALLQQDMTGFTGNMDPNDIHMGLIGDYTTPGLNDFIKMVIDNYCDIPYHETECGYACSDHASAIEHGYPASFVIESEMKLTSKYIHSTFDTIDRIDWEHVAEHAKLTVGFAYELSMSKVKEF